MMKRLRAFFYRLRHGGVTYSREFECWEYDGLLFDTEADALGVQKAGEDDPYSPLPEYLR